ncbi:hypothetical protein PsYK624_082300 [Phanerochaete sordida]|uniref:Protein kinase domain-containing protein n=1 Tax=Phanerochaete sordida TaxID=48140 RepID=A0A9P3GA91_9APHY|nr:hypothetical protein PsYK624_082300 [Phanerochaete sordida]
MSFLNHLVGAMPPRQFITRFMAPRRVLPPAPSSDFTQICNAESLEDAQHAFICAVEDSHLCPSLRFYIPKLKQHQIEVPDEHSEDQGVGAVAIVPPHLSLAACNTNGRGNWPREDLSQYHDFASSSLEVQISLDKDQDSFLDVDEHPLESDDDSVAGPTSDTVASFEGNTAEVELVRERLLKSAHALFSRQHRTFLFQVVICDECACFILYDRAGAVVTQHFDYIQNPDILADFLWRFSYMDDLERGSDPSAIPATPSEAALLTDAIHDLLDTFQHSIDEQEAPRVIPGAEHSLDPSDTYPVHKIRVVDSATGDTTELVVLRPFAGDCSLFGRSTRAYLAYDIKARRLVFFKDTWRANDDCQRAESDILRDLHANNVPFVPKVLYGSDVLGTDGVPQQTVVDELSTEQAEWRCTDTPLLGHVHHRIVQDIFYPLQNVRGERELIQALHDTIITLDTAHQKMGIMHRDLSYQNVMLDSEGRCVVNDWDSAGPFTPDGGAVGTLQFMSIRLLDNEDLPNEPVDDMQSLFWVLNFVAILRFALHYDRLRNGLFVNNSPTADDDRSRISMVKAFSLTDDSLYRGRYRSAALTELIAELVDDWGQYQRAVLVLSGTFIRESELRREMLDLAPMPSYWLEKFAAALQKYDAEEGAARVEKTQADDPDPLHDSDGSQVAFARSKRKVVDIDSIGSAHDDVSAACGSPQIVRPSKKLRI